jgi:hypothetical protein
MCKLNFIASNNFNRRTLAKCENAPSFCLTRSIQLPLANRCDLTGTSQPMLGVLFFPLSPPSHKGATHTIPENSLAPKSPRKVKLPLVTRAGYPNSHKRSSVKTKIQQRNVTHKNEIHTPPPPSFL